MDPKRLRLHVLPTLWFRNTWSWESGKERPSLQRVAGTSVIQATNGKLGERFLSCDGAAELLFTENETNTQRIFGQANHSPYVKDSINDYVVHGQKDAVNPQQTGTKAAAHYRINVPSNGSHTLRLRLSPLACQNGSDPFADFDDVLAVRHKEADQFYDTVIPRSLSADQANVMRQALAGMMWTKQFYHYDVNKWLEERGSDIFKPNRKPAPRNDAWHHMYNGDIISMPDKWEYP